VFPRGATSRRTPLESYHVLSRPLGDPTGTVQGSRGTRGAIFVGGADSEVDAVACVVDVGLVVADFRGDVVPAL
jgi:hypothetical protein